MAELDGPRWGPRDQGPPKQLVVLCHGVGADGHDLIDLAPHWADGGARRRLRRARCARALRHGADRPAMVQRRRPIAAACSRPAWRSRRRRCTASSTPNWPGSACPADAYALMGFSQGAMTVLYTGLRRAVPPRAILAYSGALMAPELLGGHHRPAAASCWCMARTTRWCPSPDLATPSRRLRAAGVPVESLFCPRLGHGIDETGTLGRRAVPAAGVCVTLR